MKRILLSAIGIIAAMASFAQVKIGVQAIGNLSSATVKTVPEVKFEQDNERTGWCWYRGRV
jgi:hypothetical protein